MKNLILIRHAKSKWQDVDVYDKERKLTNKGKNASKKIGKKLCKLGLETDIVYSSEAKRAKSTIKRIAKKWGIDKTKIIYSNILYNFEYKIILDFLVKMENYDTVTIVGHNPALTDLLNYLTHSAVEQIPTCGVVSIKLDIETWGDIHEECGLIEIFEYPKKDKI